MHSLDPFTRTFSSLMAAVVSLLIICLQGIFFNSRGIPITPPVLETKDTDKVSKFLILLC